MCKSQEREERIINEAKFMVTGKHTIRTTAMQFNKSKSMVHIDMTVHLKNIDNNLYNQVKDVIEFNKKNRPQRCGDAIKKKYRKV